MKKILYVDDEPLNIELFRLNFQNIFDVYTCLSPLDALSVIEENNIKVMITDYKMPQMNGMELISITKEKYPYLVCLILSGYLESNVTTDKTKVFRYLMKPFKKEDIIKHLEAAFQESQTNS